VKTWRSRRGISQEELAGRAGLHRTYVSDVERGSRNVSLASIDRLAAALEVSAAQLFAEMGSAADDSPPSAPPLRERLLDVLFIEDRAEDAELAIHALQSSHFANRIHWVRDGEGALAFLFGQGVYAGRSLIQPQLILLDLGLPKISGQEVLQRVKSDPRTRDIPVVVLTASGRDRDIIASRQLGADAYLVKPVEFRNLSEVAPRLKLYWGLLRGPVATQESPVAFA